MVDDINDEQSQAKSLSNTCAGPSSHVCLRLPPNFEPAGGGYDRRVDANTQDRMDDRGIISTSGSGGIAHPTTGGIVTMMGGINPTPGSITPMTCCIIPITGNIVLLLMVAVIVPMTGSRVLTVGGRFPMMGERIGAGNPAGSTVNAAAWDWVNGAPLCHLRRESTTYAGVLLDTDGSMKWHRQKRRAYQFYKFTIYSSRCRTFFTMLRVSW